MRFSPLRPQALGVIEITKTWLLMAVRLSPTLTRGYMRMTLGEAKGLDDASHVFDLAGPELGEESNGIVAAGLQRQLRKMPTSPGMPPG